MNANATNFVHELDMHDVISLFERARSFKPQREINVLFSGGEATFSPVFLDAVHHAKSVGFHRLHVATNGIRFAQEKDFAVRARAAGLHAVYLQLDGVTDVRGVASIFHVRIVRWFEPYSRCWLQVASLAVKLLPFSGLRIATRSKVGHRIGV